MIAEAQYDGYQTAVDEYWGYTRKPSTDEVIDDRLQGVMLASILPDSPGYGHKCGVDTTLSNDSTMKYVIKAEQLYSLLN